MSKPPETSKILCSHLLRSLFDSQYVLARYVELYEYAHVHIRTRHGIWIRPYVTYQCSLYLLGYADETRKLALVQIVVQCTIFPEGLFVSVARVHHVACFDTLYVLLNDIMLLISSFEDSKKLGFSEGLQACVGKDTNFADLTENKKVHSFAQSC